MSTKVSSLFLRRFAFARMIFWLFNAVAVVIVFTFASKFWASASVLYLVLVSLYANFATDASIWQSARVEVKQDISSGEIEVETESASGDVAVKKIGQNDGIS